MSDHPVASLDALKRDGVDIAKFGSCAERVKKGTKTVILGCDHHGVCPWASEPMEDVEVDGVKYEGGLRPRNKKYVQVKKMTDGKRRVREGWCSCFEWHENFAKKHGHNGVVVKVTGGEGDSVLVRGSKMIPATGAGREPTWEPKFWKEKVPVFKPSQADDLVTEAYAEQVIKESGLIDEQVAVREALGMSAEAKDVAGEMDDEQVRKLIGQ